MFWWKSPNSLITCAGMNGLQSSSQLCLLCSAHFWLCHQLEDRRYFSWTLEERAAGFQSDNTSGVQPWLWAWIWDMRHLDPGSLHNGCYLQEFNHSQHLFTPCLRAWDCSNPWVSLKTLIPQSLLALNCSSVLYLRDFLVFKHFPQKATFGS